MKPWDDTDGAEIGDSDFMSVPRVIRLKTIELCYVGAMKTATKECPMQLLGAGEPHGGKGSKTGLITKDEDTQALSF